MNSHVEAELLAYLDEELSEQERARVEAHLAECAQCATELEHLRVLRQELDDTFEAALAPVRLPPAADVRIRDRLQGRLDARAERRPWWELWQRRGLFAQALLAVLVLAFALTTHQTLSLPTAPQETLVFGQEQLAPGSQAALQVVVRNADEEAEPIEGAEVIVRIGRTPGLASIVYTGHTDARGAAEVAFTVPEDLEGQASLVIETSSPSGREPAARFVSTKTVLVTVRRPGR